MDEHHIAAVKAVDQAVEEILTNAKQRMRRAGADTATINVAMIAAVVGEMVSYCPRCEIGPRILVLVEDALEGLPNGGELGTQ